MSLQNVVKRYRVRKNWNQEQLAKRSGITQALIFQIESGKIVNIKSDTIKGLALALEIRIDKLLEFDYPLYTLNYYIEKHDRGLTKPIGFYNHINVYRYKPKNLPWMIFIFYKDKFEMVTRGWDIKEMTHNVLYGFPQMEDYFESKYAKNEKNIPE